MASSFQIEQQLESEWCWAAVGVSVQRYFPPNSPLQQCQLASNVLSRIGGNPVDCCLHPDDFDVSEHLEYALGGPQTGGINVLKGIGPRLPFEQIQAQIKDSLPVCVRIEWPGLDRGHFVVIYGYGVTKSREQWVYVADPFYEYWLVPYNQFLDFYQGDGRWTDTYLVQPPPPTGGN
jgi:hypothetical protein